MNFLIVLLFILTSAFAEEPGARLSNFDSKVYSLKTKGVRDFVVDISSSKLTQQLNQMLIFGDVKSLIFRTYWTSNPERLAVEVVGLPDGFKEIKEDLKLSLMGMIEYLIPPTQAQRFAGYVFKNGASASEVIAQDKTGLAATPGFKLIFDEQERLSKILAMKPVGSLESSLNYEKESFTDGKWLLKAQVQQQIEQGQSLTTKKVLSYGSSQGIATLSQVRITFEQKGTAGDSKSSILEETIEFKNYKINSGEALKYFLGESGR
jgi:hypothetical protein